MFRSKPKRCLNTLEDTGTTKFAQQKSKPAGTVPAKSSQKSLHALPALCCDVNSQRPCHALRSKKPVRNPPITAAPTAT